MWTEQHVELWRETGKRPSAVMVWTPDQIGAFLDEAVDTRLYAFYHLLLFRGLRRGEGVGTDWVNVDLDDAALTVHREIIVDGWTPIEEDPKTEESAATIALDSLTVAVLREHRQRQDAERETAGDAWTETGKVFTDELGGWLHPDKVSEEFRRIYQAAGLPPINLRDARHCAALLIHASGGDIHSVKEVLWHAPSSSRRTRTPRSSRTSTAPWRRRPQHWFHGPARMLAGRSPGRVLTHRSRRRLVPREAVWGPLPRRTLPRCSERQFEIQARWGGWDSNPRPTDYESAALTG
jgi:integrase